MNGWLPASLCIPFYQYFPSLLLPREHWTIMAFIKDNSPDRFLKALIPWAFCDFKNSIRGENFQTAVTALDFNLDTVISTYPTHLSFLSKFPCSKILFYSIQFGKCSLKLCHAQILPGNMVWSVTGPERDIPQIMNRCCSVTKQCPTPCGPMDCSTPGFPVLHHLPEFPQIHVHWLRE